MDRLTCLGVAVLACLALSVSGVAGAPVRVEASRMSMACLYSIVAYGPDARVLSDTLEQALDEVDRIDRLMSNYKRDSELSRLNREAGHGMVAVDTELFDLIAESMRYSAESDGAFDVTVGPLMKAWGFFNGEGRIPSAEELARLRERIGYQHVVLDRERRTVGFDRDGVELDLGAIAKGYAVDRVVALLRAKHVRGALVSAGGSTIYAIGAPPGQRHWNVDVQDPRDARKVAFTVPLRDRALSVAGRSEKSFEIHGVEYTHIMDPRTAKPVRGVLSVVVLANSGTASDALDTTLFVLGAERGCALLRKPDNAEAYFLLPRGERDWRVVHVGAACGPDGSGNTARHTPRPAAGPCQCP
jgi:thiamine biosynthesis lipoprotein